MLTARIKFDLNKLFEAKSNVAFVWTNKVLQIVLKQEQTKMEQIERVW